MNQQSCGSATFVAQHDQQHAAKRYVLKIFLLPLLSLQDACIAAASVMLFALALCLCRRFDRACYSTEFLCLRAAMDAATPGHVSRARLLAAGAALNRAPGPSAEPDQVAPANAVLSYDELADAR